MLNHPFHEEIPADIQPDLPLAQAEAVSFHLVTCCPGKQTSPHLGEPSCQGAVEGSEVSPGPFLFINSLPSLCFEHNQLSHWVRIPLGQQLPFLCSCSNVPMIKNHTHKSGESLLLSPPPQRIATSVDLLMIPELRPHSSQQHSWSSQECCQGRGNITSFAWSKMCFLD